MQRTSPGVWVGGILAIGAFVVGLFLLRSPETDAELSATPQDMTAAVFESFASQSQDANFISPSGPWKLSLPEDHGGHEDARVETWTLLAHLSNENGEVLGVQLSIARLGLIAPDEIKEAPDLALSALYRAHVILADAAMDTGYAEERLSRGFGAAGHNADAREIWLDDWLVAYGQGERSDGLRLDVTVQDVPISLLLTPQKPAERITQDQGMRGFAIPRLSVDGQVGDTHVKGTAILNRAWGDVPLPGGATANDIFSLQLDDGSDLALVRTTQRDGRGAAVFDGLLSEANATIITLSDTTYSLEPVPTGEPKARAELNATWRISGPDMSLEVMPLVAAHHDGFAFRFSSGLLRVTGARNGAPVMGLGSLQRIGREPQ